MTESEPDGNASGAPTAAGGRAVDAALGRQGARGLTPPPRGRRSTGKIVRDSLLILVILAMGLPFVMAVVGGVSVSAEQQDLVNLARRAAYAQQDWLGNSMAHKVVVASPLPSGGLHVRERYYTFWGIPWGWSEADVSAAGEVTGLRTGLSIHGR